MKYKKEIIVEAFQMTREKWEKRDIPKWFKDDLNHPRTCLYKYKLQRNTSGSWGHFYPELNNQEVVIHWNDWVIRGDTPTGEVAEALSPDVFEKQYKPLKGETE